MSRDCSVIVTGGGPAGSAAAIVLAKTGRQVLLVDDSPDRAFRFGEALPPAARPLLRDLGVLDRFLADGHLPCYGNVSSWGSDDLSATDFLFNPHGHGWHLDRARFDAMLRAAARDAGSTVMSGTRLLGASRQEDGAWKVSVNIGKEDRREIRCEWLIDATGRRAAVARAIGVSRIHHDRLVAIHARLEGPANCADRDSRTLIEARPDGWWYSALVPRGIRVAAYLTDSDLVERPVLLSPDGFRARLVESRHLQAAVDEYGYTLSDRPRVTDASTSRLDRFAGPGWLAVGDAAVSFDPISSQGIMTALYTGLRAGQAIDRGLGGDPAAIEEYVRRLESIHDAYSRNLVEYYSLERRWPDPWFWRRRNGSMHS